MKHKNLVILGNGGAAINGIKAIRSTGYTGEIIQVSDTIGPAFNPMLSPYYLKGKITWNDCFPFGIDFYKIFDVTCHFGVNVESLDAVNRRVYLSDNEILDYDQCLIATGASPIIPPIPGLNGCSKSLTLRTAEDTKNIEKVLNSANKAIIIGASLVGVKLAEILSKNNIRTILFDIVPQVLPKGAHPNTALSLEKYFTEHNIELRLGCTLEHLEEGSKDTVCYFSGEIKEETDFVAVCTGIKPNTDFIDKSQVDMGEAILVDQMMRTCADGLYAAGDVCQGMNRQTGKNEYLGTWGNACYQGLTAGLNMAGKYTIYAGIIPQYISPFFDWTYAQMGDINRDGEETEILTEGDPFKGSYRLLAFEKNILVGANLINRENDVGITRNAIIRRLSKDEFLGKMYGFPYFN